MLEITNVFTREHGGYALYRIPGVVCAADGAVLAYGEARRTREWGDWAEIDILLRRSPDGGKTWYPRQVIALGGGETANNPVAVFDRQLNVVHFLYCRNYAQIFHRWSADNGETFSDPVEITGALEKLQDECPWNVCATGPGHMIQLRSGRILCPVWITHRPLSGRGHPRARDHSKSSLAVIWSDDHGDTWERSALVIRDSEAVPSPNETSAVELENGHVMLNVRTPSMRNRRVVVTSADGGESWSEARYDENLFEPVCCAGFCRHPQDGPGGKARLLFTNPDSQHLPSAKCRPDGSSWYERANLTVRMSEDGGKTWPTTRVLDRGQTAYSDLAVGADGTVYCFYERGDGPDGYAHLALARFDPNWITA